MAKTILLVDDSPTIRQFVCAVLSQAGYEILEASNGKDGLILMDGRRIHLILSDLNMPILDGLAFVRCARGVDDYKHVPVIMMTTESSMDRREEALSEGVRAWVTKPLNPQTLLDAVAKIL